jgi:hypothetical protein
MSNRGWIPFALAAVCVACSSLRDGSQALSPERAAVVESDVRKFAATVAQDVAQEGPAAWRKHFANSRAFFMASEGRLQFPDSASAITGIQELTRVIKHIELQWGDIRVDPLTPELAQMGATWHEVSEDNTGKRVEDDGYFTGIAELRNGRWQFRNAHWSVASAAPVVR